MSQMEKPRSSFVYKLHELLSAEHHPEWLRWISNDTFGITSVESQAKAALTPQWEFRSLASFIRQLSYYSFKRLSDRRRSAERRSHSPSLIVFTHTSGNFVRDDISKTLNIPRKLRSRKKSTAGSRRKSSTASSIAFDYEYEYHDRSPSPDPHHTRSEDEGPTPTHLNLANYQLQPWTAVHESHIAASPRSLPFTSPAQVPLPTAREEAVTYELVPAEAPFARSYPSPVAANSASAYSYASPSSIYREPYTNPSQPSYHHTSPSFYYPAQYAAQSSSISTACASNELPPIRTITSGLVGPPSPPVESYSHYPQQIIAPQPVRRRSSHVFVGEVENGVALVPLPPAHQTAPATAVPNGLVAMHQVDPYYPPTPPRHAVQPTHVSPSNHFYPSSTFSCASQASDRQQDLSRSGEWMYTTAAYH
ncbi:hypothetical protein JCM11491_000010 [Sporobolomyces phaffii]